QNDLVALEVPEAGLLVEALDLGGYQHIQLEILDLGKIENVRVVLGKAFDRRHPRLAVPHGRPEVHHGLADRGHDTHTGNHDTSAGATVRHLDLASPFASRNVLQAKTANRLGMCSAGCKSRIRLWKIH